MATNVRVVCRFRPLNSKEIAAGSESIVLIEPDGSTVKLKGSESNHTFTFDRIFGSDCTQKDVFDYAAKPVVEDILRGYNGTIFVYGQTSSGKTHTMQGPSIDDPELRGIIPRMNTTVFEGVAKADPNIEFLVKASYIEIYMEKIRDLLDASKQSLQVREEKTKGIWVEGATEIYLTSEQDVLDVIRIGTSNRAIAETKMNFESSRSHSIFILTVSQKNLSDLSNKNGKLYLVDLAGSEKVEKTGAQGTTLDEAKTINKSLSALGNVINALTDGKSSHVPYRDSKLTRVLQESLGGNSRTTLIINCSPALYNEAETLSTLRFGNRAKSIKNTAKINQERSVAELKLLLAKAEKEMDTMQTTINALQEEVRLYRGGGAIPVSASSPSGSLEALPSVMLLQEKCSDLENQVKKLEEEKLSLSEMHESILDEMRDKEQDLELVESLKEELSQLKATEQTLNKENELLIVKLADITIDNEKMQYENSESLLTIESLTAQNSALKEQMETLQQRFDSMAAERSSKPPKMTSLMAFKKDQEEWAEKEVQLKKSVLDNMSRIEEIELALNNHTSGAAERQDAAVMSPPNAEIAQALLAEEETATDIDELSNKQELDIVARLKKEIESQKKEMERMKREKDVQQANFEQLRRDYEKHLQLKVEQNIEAHRSEGNPDIASKLEGELQIVREQTNQKLAEFDAIKSALLRDLENRCQKVIELEILLDEAREQYGSLLIQVKNSNSKTLQQKAIFLQRNLEQLTTVQQQLVNENNRLKLENQVYVKQLAIRNERIHGLELLLQDAQEKLQKHATSELEANLNKGDALKKAPGVKKAIPPAVAPVGIVGGRIAKPIRGGGGQPTPLPPAQQPQQIQKTLSSSGSPSLGRAPDLTPERKSTSIWDLFKGKGRDRSLSSADDQLSAPNSPSSPHVAPSNNNNSGVVSEGGNQ